jgi:hypothetical protein
MEVTVDGKKEKKWVNPDGYVTFLRGKADNETVKKIGYSTDPATGNTPAAADISATKSNDDDLVARLKPEYCFFRSRYDVYLAAFLAEIGASSSRDTVASELLKRLINLNDKLNAFATFVDWYSNARAGVVNARTTALNTLNGKIQESASAPSLFKVETSEAVLNTRKEMVRYTKEKNNAITNQISLWASLNVVAIAIIFHLYRTL